MFSHNFLDILACPACKGQFSMAKNGQELQCQSCNACFPIRDGIPVLLHGADLLDTPAPSQPVQSQGQ